MDLTFRQRARLTPARRRDWYHALSKVARSGLGVHDALENMAVGFEGTSHPLRPLVDAVLPRIRGAGNSKTVEGRRTLGSELLGMVPFDEAMLIRAGDLSGRTHEGLAQAAKLVETKQRLRGSIIKALTEPVSYLVAFVGLLLFVATSLVPEYEKSAPRATWDTGAQSLAFVADHVFIVCALIVSAIAAVVGAFRWIAPNWSGDVREWCDRHVFPFTMIAKFNGASVLASIAGYISADVPFDKAIANLSDTSTPYLKAQCARVTVLLKQGKRPSEALCSLPIVPSEHHWLIRTYAMSADAAAAYETMAAELVEGTEIFVQRVFTVVAKAMLLTIAGFLFWVYTSFYSIGASGGLFTS